jgi:hypothetical protein
VGANFRADGPRDARLAENLVKQLADKLERNTNKLNSCSNHNAEGNLKKLEDADANDAGGNGEGNDRTRSKKEEKETIDRVVCWAENDQCTALACGAMNEQFCPKIHINGLYNVREQFYLTKNFILFEDIKHASNAVCIFLYRRRGSFLKTSLTSPQILRGYLAQTCERSDWYAKVQQTKAAQLQAANPHGTHTQGVSGHHHGTHTQGANPHVNGHSAHTHEGTLHGSSPSHPRPATRSFKEWKCKKWNVWAKVL